MRREVKEGWMEEQQHHRQPLMSLPRVLSTNWANSTFKCADWVWEDGEGTDNVADDERKGKLSAPHSLTDLLYRSHEREWAQCHASELSVQRWAECPQTTAQLTATTTSEWLRTHQGWTWAGQELTATTDNTSIQCYFGFFLTTLKHCVLLIF